MQLESFTAQSTQSVLNVKNVKSTPLVKYNTMTTDEKMSNVFSIFLAILLVVIGIINGGIGGLAVGSIGVVSCLNVKINEWNKEKKLKKLVENRIGKLTEIPEECKFTPPDLGVSSMPRTISFAGDRPVYVILKVDTITSDKEKGWKQCVLNFCLHPSHFFHYVN